VSTEDTQEESSDQEYAGQATDIPEPSDEHVEKAKEMAKVYDEDRPTVTLPGSDGTVSGTAINDWLDDDGNAIDQSKDNEDAPDADSKPDDEG
jgi:hypothetical protein